MMHKKTTSLSYFELGVDMTFIIGHNLNLSGLVAQSVEQRTFNPLVAGSNPAQPTRI